MRAFRLLPVLALLASCVAPRGAPPPPPRPAPPPPLPVAPPADQDWRDIPLSPGTWTYAAEPGGSSARFGPAAASFTVRCDIAARQVTLAREGSSANEAPLIDITTSAGRQSFRGQSLSSRPAIAAQLAASDPFLDKMAFSRGRFIVAASGTARLAIPSWPEFARVVEDCRG